MPPERDFWDTSIPLPFRLRNAAALFEWELTEWKCRASPLYAQFVGMTNYAPTSVHDLLDEESSGLSSETVQHKDSHPSWQCNMVHVAVT
jgi:hypothetical protein